MIIYYYDESTRKLQGADYLDDNAEIPVNATTIAPLDLNGETLFEPVFNGTDKWTGTSQDDYLKKYGVDLSKDNLPKVVANLVAQMAKLNLDVQAIKSKGVN